MAYKIITDRNYFSILTEQANGEEEPIVINEKLFPIKFSAYDVNYKTPTFDDAKYVKQRRELETAYAVESALRNETFKAEQNALYNDLQVANRNYADCMSGNIPEPPKDDPKDEKKSGKDVDPSCDKLLKNIEEISAQMTAKEEEYRRASESAQTKYYEELGNINQEETEAKASLVPALYSFTISNQTTMAEHTILLSQIAEYSDAKGTAYNSATLRAFLSQYTATNTPAQDLVREPVDFLDRVITPIAEEGEK